SPSQQPGRTYPAGQYALSIKTEDGKYRTVISPALAEPLISDGIAAVADLNYLPADLLSRYLELSGEEKLYPVVTVCFTRYAVESTTDRITLDTCITTSRGKKYPCNVLEIKGSDPKSAQTPSSWGFNPIRLSKFLWATS